MVTNSWRRETNMTNKRFWIRRGPTPKLNRSHHNIKNSKWQPEVCPLLYVNALTPHCGSSGTNYTPNSRFINWEHPSSVRLTGQDYDIIRNKTLLFFFDRLIEKGQPRTLHDLSCQFGSKGFTKEMRQIAGGNQSGLRKLLSQYPSLFTINGDYVSLTNHSNIMSGSEQASRRQDNYEEAVEFFRDKLTTYGVTEVPIKSLLGHRSQARPEIRYISGQHIEDFKNFLQKFPDVFIVQDDNVFLKKNFELLQNNDKTSNSRSFEYETLNSELMDKLLTFLENLIEVKGPLTINQLFSQLSTEMRLKIKYPQDLVNFLRIQSSVFLIQSNMVMLIKPVTTHVKEKKMGKIEMEIAELEAKIKTASSKKIILTNREFCLLRYLELSDEDWKKMNMSHKIGCKRDINSDNYSDQSTEDFEIHKENGEYEIEDDDAYSSSSQITSLSNFDNRHVDEYLNNFINMKTFFGVNKSKKCCQCNCHKDNSTFRKDSSDPKREFQSTDSLKEESTKLMSDASCQTLSTGDVVLTKLFFNDNK